MLKILLLFIIAIGKCDRTISECYTITDSQSSLRIPFNHKTVLLHTFRFLSVQICLFFVNHAGQSESKSWDGLQILEHSFKLERCNNCTRTRQPISLSTVHFSNTSCGRDAYMRGHHQKVVSFSFYGNKSSPSHLLQGFFLGNLELHSYKNDHCNIIPLQVSKKT